MVQTSKRVTLTNDNRVMLGKDKYDNIISIGEIDFEMKPLSNNMIGSRGGNSTVFKLVLANEDDAEEYGSQEYVIKISNIDIRDQSSFCTNRKKRFQREIIALKKANEKKLRNVVRMISHGEIQIQGRGFLFYTMEKANSDLTDYLKIRRTTQQKILLFQSILDGMQRIGAFGWECPEAMNFFFSERAPENPEFAFDDKIDEASDIFQLGKLFWYILQGNLPIGCIEPEDFRIADTQLFNILLLLLQHGKTKHGSQNRRPITIREVKAMVAGVARKYAA
jgi:hypothetical protein